MEDEMDGIETYADFLRAMIARQTRPELRAILERYLEQELAEEKVRGPITGRRPDPLH